jgi:hypothetical protein
MKKLILKKKDKPKVTFKKKTSGPHKRYRTA